MGSLTDGKTYEMTSKLSGLLGFASRARKLEKGYNTCLLLIKRKKARLVLITEDAAEGTVSKISGKCRANDIPYYIYGKTEEISKITGNTPGTVFTVTDKGFAEAIIKEIDRIRSEGE